MKRMIIACIATLASFPAAQAGGWGGSSGGLVNVSPSVAVGSITALNGIAALNGNAVLSGNKLSGILNGNDTGIVSGVLNNFGVGVLSGNNGYKLKKH